MKTIKTKFDGHTPGPWRWDEKHECWYKKDGNHPFNPSISGGDVYMDILPEDAHLCAAAPDMKDELLRCLEYIEAITPRFNSSKTWKKQRIEAIKKLLGVE
jgi:hypothetical protein